MIKSRKELGEDLCDYCPLEEHLKGVYCYGGEPVFCYGINCEKAYKYYCEQYEKDEETNTDDWIKSLSDYK